LGVAILCPFGILKTIRKRGNNMKAITKGFIDMLINFIYLMCIFIGYLGMLGWRADMVIGCLVVALCGNLVKRGLKLGAYK